MRVYDAVSSFTDIRMPISGYFFKGSILTVGGLVKHIYFILYTYMYHMEHNSIQ